MKALILAGGKGRRLMPYTTTIPKPLMPIGDHAILEIVVKQLKLRGFNEIFMATGHLGELIMSYFDDGEKFGVNIKYTRELEPLGTAGPLTLVKDEIDDSFLVMNGDILTTIDYSKLMKYHQDNNGIATVALKRRDVNIDFGVTEINDADEIIKYTEKPTNHYLVSMGVYVFDKRIFEYIKPGEYLDFPDLVNELLKNQETVNGFVFDGYWLDIGRPDDYERANNEIKGLYPELFQK
ncbi:MAG: NTP transferase domain-containing protein [Methanobacterium sp.]|nr:NTP transferase domain-containing protein [Methanobacterium sp.]